MRSQTNRQAYMDSAPALKKTFDATTKRVGDAWQEIINEDVAAVAAYAENLELIKENIPIYVEGLDERGISGQGQREAIGDEMEEIATNYNGYLEELEGLQGKLNKKSTARKKELKKLIGAGNKRLKNIVSETGKLADLVKSLGENNGRVSAANNYTEGGRKSVAGLNQLTNPSENPPNTGSVGMFTTDPSGYQNAWFVQVGSPATPPFRYDKVAGDLLIGEEGMSIKEMSDGVILKAEVEGAKIQELIDGAYNVTFANPSSLERAKGQATSQLTQHILGSGTNSLSDDAVMSLAADDNLIGDKKGAELVSRETLRSGDVKAVREELFKSLEFLAHFNLEEGKKAEEDDFERQQQRRPGTGSKFNPPPKPRKLTAAEEERIVKEKEDKILTDLNATAPAYAENSPTKEEAQAFAKALHEIYRNKKMPTPRIVHPNGDPTSAASTDQVVSRIRSNNVEGIVIEWASKKQAEPSIPETEIAWKDFGPWFDVLK